MVKSRPWALFAGVALLFAAVFITYWPAIHGQFLWDDQINIDRNPLVRSDSGLIGIWTAAPGSYDYYPLTWTAWWLQWRAFARETTGYHVVNLVMHAAACVALWRLLVRLGVSGAFVAAMVFAVHPVNVETAAWISEQKNTFSLLLALTSALLWLDAREGTGGRRACWASVVVFALALLAKPSVVALPTVLLLMAWWRDGRGHRRTLGREFVATIPMFVVAGLVAAATVYIHHTRGIQDVFIRDDGFAARLAGAGMAIAFYLSKLVAPVNLSFVYPRWSIDPRSVVAWLPLTWVVIAMLALIYGRRWWGRGPATAFASYVLLLVPVLGFVDVYFMRFSFVADHWQYPACGAVIALLVTTGSAILRSPKLGACVGVLVCVTLSILARGRAAVYQSELNLWADTVAKNPSGPMPKLNYGGVLFDLGRQDEAIALYRQAIELSPDEWDGHTSLAKAYTLMGRERDAIAAYRQAAERRRGGGPDPRVALAGALAARGHGGDTAEAIRLLEQARIGRDADAVPGMLAPLYDKVGQPDRALAQYRLSAQLFPESEEDHFQLGLALLARHAGGEADTEFARVRQLTGLQPSILHGFGSRLLTVGHPRQAADFFRAALAADPSYTPSRTSLSEIEREH
jgi:Flp pilus assembly protein TadD